MFQITESKNIVKRELIQVILSAPVFEKQPVNSTDAPLPGQLRFVKQLPASAQTPPYLARQPTTSR